MTKRVAYAEHLRQELQQFASYEFHLPPREKVERALDRLRNLLGVEASVQQRVQSVQFLSLARLVKQANVLSMEVKKAYGA